MLEKQYEKFFNSIKAEHQWLGPVIPRYVGPYNQKATGIHKTPPQQKSRARWPVPVIPVTEGEGSPASLGKKQDLIHKITGVWLTW
jgi:hypothetical protein